MGKKLLFNNTYKSGHVSYLAFKDKKGYTAVCLEFDLVINADTLEESKELIEELTHAWLENVVKNKLPEELLNKPAPSKYKKMFSEITNLIQKGGKLEKQSSSSEPLFGSFETYPSQTLFA